MDVTCSRREASALIAPLLIRAERIDDAVATGAPVAARVHTGVTSAGGLAIEVLVPTGHVTVAPPGSAPASLLCTRAATATDSQAMLAAIARMPAHAVRRRPVADAPAALSGTVTCGDLRKMSWSDVRACFA